MKYLITYIFIAFIFANLILSLLGWYTSNQEKGMSYNDYTIKIDTVWQTPPTIKTSIPISSKDNKELKNNFPYIVELKQFINAIIEARPAFQHTYIESYGYLQRILGRQLMEDASIDNDVVRQPNGQLNFFGKIKDIYTKEPDTANRQKLLTSIISFKKYLSEKSPSSNLLFIARLDKGYGLSPYNLRGNPQKQHKDKAKEFTNLIQESNIPILNLNEYIGTNRKEIFYNTDHHWRIEYAFKSLPLICQFLNINDSIYSENDFEFIDSKKQFIGSLSKRTGSLFTTLTDTCKYYKPKFKTYFTAKYYSTNNTLLYREGPWDKVLLFEEFLHDKYDANLYNVCNKGDNPLVKIENHDKNANGNILILGDSFSAPLISYLSISYKKMDCIDLRSCNKEILYSMICKNEYDTILLIYPSYYDEKMYNF